MPVSPENLNLTESEIQKDSVLINKNSGNNSQASTREYLT